MTNANLKITRSTAGIETAKLKAYAASGAVSAEIDVKIIVCGDETITLVDSTKLTILNGLLTGT